MSLSPNSTPAAIVPDVHNGGTSTPSQLSVAEPMAAEVQRSDSFSNDDSSQANIAALAPLSSSSVSNASTPSINPVSSSASLAAAANTSINALLSPDASTNSINEFFNILNKSQNLVPKDVSNITKDPVLIEAYQKILFFNPDGTYQEAVNSCQRCRKLKKKCTKHKPKCLNCFKTNYECIYIERSQDGNFVSTFTSGDNYLNSLAPNQYIIKDTVSHVGSLGQVGQQLIENHARGIISKNIPIPQGSHTKRIKPNNTHKSIEKLKFSQSLGNKSLEANDPLLFSSPNIAQLYHGIIDQASKIRKSTLVNASSQGSSPSLSNSNNKKPSSSLLSQNKSAGPDSSSYLYSSLLASAFPPNMNIFQPSQNFQNSKGANSTNATSNQTPDSLPQPSANHSSVKFPASSNTSISAANASNNTIIPDKSSSQDTKIENGSQSAIKSTDTKHEKNGVSEVPGVPTVTGEDKNVIDDDSIDPSLFQ